MSTNTRYEVIIIGAGGHGKEIASCIRDMATQGAKVCMRGFVDENKPKGGFAESDILGGFDDLTILLRDHADKIFYYITAVGDNRTRAKLVTKAESLRMNNLNPWTLRSPRATIGHNVEIGEGSCLAPGSIITTHVNLGKHCILNVNASVSHDCWLGDFVNINPGALICGNVNIGEGCYVGAGATIIDKVSIGDWAVIGAGAVVIEDVPPGVTAVGVPAKIIKHSNVPT
jgi:sugar O-acyltransferase (sialic acid O-acetyltransferase NeuD family)